MISKIMYARDQIGDIQKRYYYWEFSNIYGWRQIGDMEGYKTIEEAKKQITEGDIWAILEGKIIDSNIALNLKELKEE